MQQCLTKANLFSAPILVAEPCRRLYSLVGNLLPVSKLVFFMDKFKMVMNLDPLAQKDWFVFTLKLLRGECCVGANHFA